MNLLTQASFRCALDFPVHSRFLRVEFEANSIHDLASSLHNADQSRLSFRRTTLAREREIVSTIDS